MAASLPRRWPPDSGDLGPELEPRGSAESDSVTGGVEPDLPTPNDNPSEHVLQVREGETLTILCGTRGAWLLSYEDLGLGVWAWVGFPRALPELRVALGTAAAGFLKRL